LFVLLRFSMIPFFAREIIQRNKVTILVYHKIDFKLADIHFKALKSIYNIIPLHEYLSARKNGEVHLLPKKSLIVTFDDGHKTNYSLKSIINKYEMPVTLFLCSRIVGTNRHYWFENNGKDNNRILKKISDCDRLKILKENGFEEETEYPDRQALSDEELEDMKNLVEYQSHTMFHPILTKCSDKKSFEEIHKSKIDLEIRLNKTIYAIAYPNGNYSEREISYTKKAGYECGLTLDPGFNSQNTDLYKLRRICIYDEGDIHELIVKASGLWDYIKIYLLKKN